MRFGGVIIARMDSSRYPGKVLTDMAGQPLLAWLVDRARQSREIANQLVLATSCRPVDDPLADFAQTAGIGLYRGDTEDVAGRVLSAARLFGLDGFVRLNGDSPVMPPDGVDQACALMRTEGVDLVTNLRPRRFPYGVSIEVIRTSSFAGLWPRMTAAGREHVTQDLYSQLAVLRWANISHDGPDLSALRLTVDEPADADRLRACLKDMGTGWAERSWQIIAAHPAFTQQEGAA